MPGSQLRETGADGRVKAWDVAVRLLHWSLAALVLFDFYQDDGGWPHRVVGYGAAAVVVARLLWAMFAGGASGLAALKPSLKGTLAYLRGGTPRTPGHDPLGLWMVWLLWALVLLLGITGWISRLDAFWGDDLIRAIHEWLAQALLVAVAVHLSGVAAMSWRWRENLVAAMLSGKKRPLDRPE
jgi:cytochrome b